MVFQGTTGVYERSYTPVVPRKPYPMPDQNGRSLYPFSDQNSAKTLFFGAAHTNIAYVREYPLPPPHGQSVSDAKNTI